LVLVYVFLGAGTLMIIFPVYLTVINAFKTPQETFRNFFVPPVSPYLGNLAYILSRSKFPIYLRNSVLVTVFSVTIIVIFTPMVSYAVTRNMYRSKLFKGFYYYFLMAMFIPFQVIMVPLTLMIQRIKLMNHAGLIICYLALSLSQGVFLYSGYIKSIPLELEESSFMDGCGILRTFFFIVYPLIMPMTATNIILNALWIWNDFQLPLLILNRSNTLWTLPLFMFNFKSQYSFEVNIAFAAFLLALLPVIVLYAFMQKYIIAGLAAGALKG
jgi:raffinose/stachyose/melibiose transport system permease protein